MVRRPPISTRTDTLLPRTTLYRSPRRAVVGWDSGRLAMVLAVLEARCGLQMGAAEVYLNIAGGYRLTDPAADLAVAAALISAFSRSEEHTSELQSLMRISYAVFCLKKKQTSSDTQYNPSQQI